MIDQAAPLILAATEIALAVVLALPAVFFRSLRRPAKLAAVTAGVVFVLVLVVAVVSSFTPPTGSTPIGTTVVLGAFGGLIWATFFFIVAYVPLALFALLRARLR